MVVRPTLTTPSCDGTFVLRGVARDLYGRIHWRRPRRAQARSAREPCGWAPAIQTVRRVRTCPTGPRSNCSGRVCCMDNWSSAVRAIRRGGWARHVSHQLPGRWRLEHRLPVELLPLHRSNGISTAHALVSRGSSEAEDPTGLHLARRRWNGVHQRQDLARLRSTGRHTTTAWPPPMASTGTATASPPAVNTTARDGADGRLFHDRRSGPRRRLPPTARLVVEEQSGQHEPRDPVRSPARLRWLRWNELEGRSERANIGMLTGRRARVTAKCRRWCPL